MAAAEQMSQALLMPGLREGVVGRPAVVDHDAGVVQAEQAFADDAGAGRVDDVGGRVGADQAMQPGVDAADVPAGLVEHGPRRFLDRLTDGGVDRLGPPGRAEDDVRAAAA